MDPFWNNIYDDAKDKRYGGLFIAVLLSFFLGLPLLALIFGAASWIFGNFMEAFNGYPDFDTFQAVGAVLLACLGLVALVLFGRRWVRVGRKARQDRLKYSNLSRDELMKARSKLKNQMKPVKFRAVERPGKPLTLRAPDIDIKY